MWNCAARLYNIINIQQVRKADNATMAGIPDLEPGDAVVYQVGDTSLKRVGLVVSIYDAEDANMPPLLDIVNMRNSNKAPKKNRPNLVEFFDTDEIVYGVPITGVAKKMPMAVLYSDTLAVDDLLSDAEIKKGAIVVTTHVDRDGVQTPCLSTQQKLKWLHFQPSEMVREVWDDEPFDANDLGSGMISVLKSELFDLFVSPLSHSHANRQPRHWNLRTWKLFIQRAMNKITESEFVNSINDVLGRERQPERFYAFRQFAPVLLACLREWLGGHNAGCSANEAFAQIGYQRDIMQDIYEQFEEQAGVDKASDGGEDEEEEDEEGDSTGGFITDASSIEDGSDDDDDADEKPYESEDDTISSSSCSSGVSGTAPKASSAVRNHRSSALLATTADDDALSDSEDEEYNPDDDSRSSDP